ncbi:glycosyltransferase domain-containing protein [Butyrivibrio sp. AE3009]|uniref:glycosyltransferase domain-containing protein n=1 Tax=Butyrivibrio sp. AE3009 TaxID=1280666 RepID=UPI0003B2E841|nr:glycosyltransferase domain-containing protein [Butyrivibrio sp. AE3009]
MQQLREFIDLVKKIKGLIESQKVDISQLNPHDISDYLDEMHVALSMDEILMSDGEHNLLASAIQRNDAAAFIQTLEAVVNECEMLDAIYELKMQRLELNICKNAEFARMAHEVNKDRLEDYYKTHDRKPKSEFSGRGVVFSAVTGKYDTVRGIGVRCEGFDYILFTDDPNLQSDEWDVRYIANDEGLDPVRLARRIKIMAPYEILSQYDYSIWIDGKIEICGDVRQYIEEYSTGEPLLCIPNYKNSSVYEEAEACILLNKDNAKLIKSQMNRYKEEQYINDSRMIDSCVLVRDHHDTDLRKVMETWWNEILHNSFRDQLSFGYSCWKNDFVYDTAPLLSYKNDFFKTYGHNNVAG